MVAAPTAPYTFVSYAAADRDRALEVADALERAGIAVWLDRRSIAGGTSWSAEIVAGVESCAALLLLVSPAAMQSPNVAQEVQLAWEGRRPLLPLLLAPAEPPPVLRYALAGRQRVELLDRPEGDWRPDLLRALVGLGLAPGAPTTPVAAVPVAPAAPAAPPTNLPRQLTSFVGREAAIAAVTGLLGTAALVTLTGVGGTGKTRLALAVAERVVAAYPDGVWLVELAPLADPGLVPQAVATALGVREQPGEPLTATLIAALAPRVLLLVLDNCEHLIDACARLADALLRHCPHLHLLATSREQLGVPGEASYRVPSLALPDRDAPAAVLAETEAVRLFVARAQAARPGFALADANAPLIAQVCARLDGIPLALELAAARLRALPLDQLGQRLDDRFRLLTGGSRTALPRQQTLQATLDWSYRLLDTDERVLLQRLSVFAGGWTLDAAEAVCADARIETWAVLDLLTGLVDKSLAVLDESGEAARYRLLETMRQYARERLAETDEGAAVRDRHRDWCLALAERAEPLLQTAAQGEWLRQLEAELDNLRTALSWCQTGAADLGLRLTSSLYRHWGYANHLTEGVQWLTHFLAAAPAPTVDRAWALGRLGWLLFGTGHDAAPAAAVLQESIALGRALDAREARFFALRHMLYILEIQQGPRGRVAALAEALAMSRELGDRFGEGIVLIALGRDALQRGDLPQAERLLDASLTLMRPIGDATHLVGILESQCSVAYRAGDYPKATLLAEATERVARDAGLISGNAALWYWGATLAWAQGNAQLAMITGERLLSWANQARPEFWVVFPLARLALARAALATGAAPRARALLTEALPQARGLTGEVTYWLGRVEWQAGDQRTALGHLRAALRLHRDRGEWIYAPDTLEAIAGVFLADGANVSSVRWLAAAAATRVAWGVPRPPSEQPGLDATLATARAALGEAAYTAAWAGGAALPLPSAVGEALALLDDLGGAEEAAP